MKKLFLNGKKSLLVLGVFFMMFIMTACTKTKETIQESKGNETIENEDTGRESESQTEIKKESEIESKEGKNGTRKVIDSDGNTVEIPDKVERAAPSIGAFAQITELVGGRGKIVASVSGLPDFFTTVFPDFLESNSEGHDTSNVEDIIASGAQVAFGPTFTEEQTEQLRGAGIAVVKINSFSNAEELMDCITLIGEILGEDAPQQAKKFNEYFQGNMDYTEELTKELSEEARVKVLMLRINGGNYTTINETDICSGYIRSAGGINVAADFEGNPNETGGTKMGINGEQIIQWSPEIILTHSQTEKDEIMKDASLSVVPAVKNEKVYVVPIGTYLWSVRSGEGALMPLWLAKIQQPEIFKDLNIEDKTKEFYSEFYKYELNQEELDKILKGQE
jgi:iron complex transport system substrate-binding protein